jgi:hypothetical protein
MVLDDQSHLLTMFLHDRSLAPGQLVMIELPPLENSWSFEGLLAQEAAVPWVWYTWGRFPEPQSFLHYVRIRMTNGELFNGSSTEESGFVHHGIIKRNMPAAFFSSAIRLPNWTQDIGTLFIKNTTNEVLNLPPTHFKLYVVPFYMEGADAY